MIAATLLMCLGVPPSLQHKSQANSYRRVGVMLDRWSGLLRELGLR